MRGLILFSMMALISIALQSCSKDSTNSAVSLDIIDRKGNGSSLSEYMSLKNIVEIKTDSIYPYGEIAEIIKLNNGFLLSDRKYVYQYTSEGELEKRIGSLGRGPKEYLEISDMHFEPNNRTLSIFSNAGRKMVSFSQDFNEVTERLVPSYGHQFCKYNGDLILFVCQNGLPDRMDNVLFIDNDGEISGSHFDYSSSPLRMVTNMSGSLFQQETESPRFLPPFSNVIYVLEAGSFVPKYNFNLGKNALKLGDYEDDDDFLEHFYKRTFMGNIFAENEHFFIVYYHHEMRRKFALCLKEEDRILTTDMVINDLLFNLLMNIKVLCVDDRNLYVVPSQHFYESIEDRDLALLPGIIEGNVSATEFMFQIEIIN